MRNKGIGLIEILIYIALLSVLFSVSFSTIFTITKEKEYIDTSNERQTYTLSMFEYLRDRLESARFISKPMLNGSSSEVVFDDNYLKPSLDSYISADHKYILVPKDITFSKSTSTYLNVYGEYIQRGNSKKPFELLFNTWNTQ